MLGILDDSLRYASRDPKASKGPKGSGEGRCRGDAEASRCSKPGGGRIAVTKAGSRVASSRPGSLTMLGGE